MNFVRTQGVVLRYINRNEADRLLIMLTPELGRIMVLTRGCRKPKSRFLAVSQLFCYSDLILQPYRDIYIMNQAEVKDSYFNIRNDIVRLSAATYIANLTEEAATTGESNFPLFRLLLQGLSFFSYSDKDPTELTLIYELKLMDLMGYRPVLDECLGCGDGQTSWFNFSIEYGGILCDKCSARDADGIPVEQSTADVMEAILEADMEKCSRIPLSPQEKRQMNKILPLYIERKLDKKIKSRDFLKCFSQ